MVKQDIFTDLNLFEGKLLNFYDEQFKIIGGNVSEDEYRTLTAYDGGSTFGSHFRHMVNYLESFVLGYPSGNIDYVSRNRGSSIESNKGIGIMKGREFLDVMSKLSLEEKPLICKKDIGEVISTTSTELAYLFDHGIHHSGSLLTIMKTNGINPPKGFGYAPSTLKYLESISIQL